MIQWIGRTAWMGGVIFVSLFASLPFFPAISRDNSAGRSDPTTGNLQIPAITPEAADRQLSSRVIPATSSIPMRDTARESSAKLDVAPVLGHDLPEGDTTDFGFKRADFATAPPGEADAAKRRRAEAQGSGPLSARSATAVIREEPPSLGDGK